MSVKNTRKTYSESDSRDSSLKADDFSSKNLSDEKTTKVKSFLGGYRHKLTRKIYHHATVQTSPSPWRYSFVLRFNRDSQTVILQDKSQQTPKDASTQVEAAYIFLKSTGDKVMEATKNYKYSDDIKSEKLNKIIILQKNIRCWLAKRELMRRKKQASLQALRDEVAIKDIIKQDTDWLRELQERRLNPRTEEDFKLIFSDLQKWWNLEAKNISYARSGASLKAAMWMLVSAESKRIEDVNRRKDKSENEICLQKRERSLRMAAKPKNWKAYKERIQVETGTTQRASNLHNIYLTLSMKYLSSQDRIDTLTNLKEIIQPYHCKLTDTLKQLADREIDLHLRGMKSTHLDGLQKRIRDLFWQFAKKPIFNPEMQNLTKMIRNDNTSPCILSCAACKCFYVLPTKSTNPALGKSILENYFQKCQKCQDIENEAWIRKDLELYKRLLKLLICEEEKKPTSSSIIYILQPNDIRQLVECVWKHQSCINGSRNDWELEFIRYNIDKSWTPWNCLLVTREESITLSRIAHSETKYDEKFKECAHQKHAEARRYFSRIPRFLPYLAEPLDNTDNFVKNVILDD